jgi:membrane-associated phospholipid phosphatase
MLSWTLVAAPLAAQPEPSEPTPTREEEAGEKTVPSDQVAPGEVVSKEGGTTVAAKPEVTPIVPEPSEPPQRAYQLYWELDVSVLALALVFAGARMIRTTESIEPPFCISQAQAANPTATEVHCDDSELNPLDRSVAGRYSPGWSTASDVGALALGIAPVVVLWPDGGFVNMLNDSVVIYQSALLASAFSGISSLNTGRGRPYIYGDEAPMDVKTSAEASLSYFSGHTAFAFAMSTSLFWTVQRRHPFSAFSWTTLAVGTTTASFVAGARIMAGKHFPTDVVAGALVGGGVGTLLPALHASPVMVTVVPMDQGATVNWLGVL